MKKRVLGRGLEALIPEVKQPSAPSSEIDIGQIVLNPSQPRLKQDEVRLEELAKSIRERGVLQPVLVRPYGNGYQLIAGERRLSAAQRAGLLKIPVVVRDVPDEQLLELALIENIQREPLNPLEEAQAYAHLMEAIGATHEQLAERLGKDRSTISNTLRLLKLPTQVRQLVSDGKLTPGHARALLALNAEPSEMLKVASMIIAKGWSVREAERWAKQQSKSKRPTKLPDPNAVAAAERLRLIMGTKVEIYAKSAGTGEIRIHYYSQDDLMRLYDILTARIIPTESDHAIQEGKSHG
jgi:ParB family chromosome partitioning protein